MKLYLLTPVDIDSEPWDPWYDKTFGFVVAAESEEKARELAQSAGGAEIGPSYSDEPEIPAWTDPSLSTCEVIATETNQTEGIVLSDEHWA